MLMLLMLLTEQVRWFFVGHEVEDRVKEGMHPREVLLSDRYSNQPLDTIERKVRQRYMVIPCSRHKGEVQAGERFHQLFLFPPRTSCASRLPFQQRRLVSWVDGNVDGDGNRDGGRSWETGTSPLPQPHEPFVPMPPCQMMR